MTQQSDNQHPASRASTSPRIVQASQATTVIRYVKFPPQCRLHIHMTGSIVQSLHNDANAGVPERLALAVVLHLQQCKLPGIPYFLTSSGFCSYVNMGPKFKLFLGCPQPYLPPFPLPYLLLSPLQIKLVVDSHATSTTVVGVQFPTVRCTLVRVLNKQTLDSHMLLEKWG